MFTYVNIEFDLQLPYIIQTLLYTHLYRDLNPYNHNGKTEAMVFIIHNVYNTGTYRV